MLRSSTKMIVGIYSDPQTVNKKYKILFCCMLHT
jgi:hypothetical protein